MRLINARVQNFRSVKDTGVFNIEKLKTILVGPNEAGKTVILKALQQLNKPEDIDGFDIIRDFPRSLYNDITTGIINAKDVEVVYGEFELEDNEKKLIPSEFHNCTYVRTVHLDNNIYHHLNNTPENIHFGDIKKDLARLSAHLDKQNSISNDYIEENKPSVQISKIIDVKNDDDVIDETSSKEISNLLEKLYPLIEEDNEKEENRYDSILEKLKLNLKQDEVLKVLNEKVPTFVLFSNFFKVKPSIHLEHLAERVERQLLEDDKYYDYGNLCLLKLLGFKARELSDIGKTQSPDKSNTDALKVYKDKLDSRTYQLNAASIRLTKEIKSIWNPNPNRPEAEKIRISADGQYLKVTVEDELGVEIELDQRSEGFQWMVSFFVVFFAEAQDKHKNAILLLDEPGTSLHGLKQREFRETLNQLSLNNQTIFTTHSPFLVGPDELDIVRVIELISRDTGTKVHTTISSSDPAGLLPLQEALGYDLAQSLFTQQKNLILEGLTDYWYIETIAQILRNDNVSNLDEKIALVFANSASKVVYYATILHAHNLKVAALLDSDNAGDQAAQQENLVASLGQKNILRTKDYVSGIPKAEIEDLLRETLIEIAKTEYSVDVKAIADSQSSRPIIDIFSKEISGFSKYKLAKAFIRWSKTNDSTKLTSDELTNSKKLIETINKQLK